MITFKSLKKAANLNPEGIIRLAESLGIETKNFSINEIINLILLQVNKRNK
jgi:hypothetical protein